MTRWCLGLPFVQERSVSQDEVKRYAAELNRNDIKLKRQGWLFVSSIAIAVLVGFQFVFRTSSLVGNDVFILGTSVIGIGLGAGGVAGSLGEVLFGSRITRILFGAAIAGLAAAFSFNGAWTQSVGPCSGIVALIGGNAMLVRQLSERKQTKRRVKDLRNDLLAGIVWRFERDFPGGEQGAIQRRSADIFPRSNILIAINDETARALAIVKVAQASAGGTGSIDAPLQTFQPAVGREDLDFRQRHLTVEEKAELGRLIRRGLRSLLVRSFILLWSVTALVHAFDAEFNHHPIEPNLKDEVIAGAFVAAFLAERLARLSRIRSDSRSGVVVVIRHKDPQFEGMDVEQLPRSGVVWSQFGAPSPWRTKK
jgi:hypothetical protein